VTTTVGGSIQHRLSVAGGALGFNQHGTAAGKG
jgi:hypothetical protein